MFLSHDITLFTIIGKHSRTSQGSNLRFAFGSKYPETCAIFGSKCVFTVAETPVSVAKWVFCYRKFEPCPCSLISTIYQQI